MPTIPDVLAYYPKMVRATGMPGSFENIPDFWIPCFFSGAYDTHLFHASIEYQSCSVAHTSTVEFCKVVSTKRNGWEQRNNPSRPVRKILCLGWHASITTERIREGWREDWRTYHQGILTSDSLLPHSELRIAFYHWYNHIWLDLLLPFQLLCRKS